MNNLVKRLFKIFTLLFVLVSGGLVLPTEAKASLNTDYIELKVTYNISPSTPTIDNYNDGAWTTDNTPTLQFDLVDTDVGDTINFQLEISTASDFSSIAVGYTEPTGVVTPRDNVQYTPSALDDGSYYWRVKAFDQVGVGSSWATANSGAIAFKVDTTTSTISSVSSAPNSSGATITWTTNEDSSSKIDYGLTNIYGSTTPETNTSPRVQSHSVVLSDLVSCSTYHYRVRSKDSALNETIDSDNTFTTTGCTGSATVDSQITSAITTASGGSLSLLSDSKGIGLSVPSSFSGSDANFQIKQVDKTETITVTSIPTSYSIIGSYLYDLKALTDIGTTISTFDNPNTITMIYGASDVSGIDESSLKIYRWDGSTWNLLTDCTVTALTKTVSCTTTHFSVFGLFGQATSTDDQTDSTSSSAPSCGDQVPEGKVPWLYGAIAQDSESILLYFTEADNPITNYVLEYGTKSGDYPYGVLDMGVNSRSQMTFLVKSLSPNTTYYFKIRGGNGCATGEWSNEISAKTKGFVSFNNLNIISSELTTIDNPTPTSTDTPTKEEISKTVEEIKPTEVKYDVKVKVIDVSNKPVEGATVTLHSNPQTTKTDKDGIAQFHKVEPGDHKVLIAYDNYEGEQSVNLQGDVKEFNLTVTVKTENVLLSPTAIWVIGIFVFIILTLVFFMFRRKKRR